jgi:nitroreductase/NAD-dependent dihydropyrimidine dehydrogenase PreA subunit
MPILGIDSAKCTLCEQCVKDCPSIMFAKGKEGKVEYGNLASVCIDCGHCVAVCPTDAILRQGMDGVVEFPEVKNPSQLISYATILKFLQSVRSIRRYKKDPVPRPVLDQVLTALSYAPAGTNLRNINYVLLSNPAKMVTISEVVATSVSSDPVMGPMYKGMIKMKRASGLDPIFLGAPHVIVGHSSDETGVDRINGGIALTYGILAAQSLGLGTCWNGFLVIAAAANKDLRKMLGVRGYVVSAMIIGYPDVKYHRVPSRRVPRVKEI